MAGRGGKRPGSGRKPGLRIRPEAQSPILIAERKLAEHLPELVDIAIRQALAGDRGLLVYCIDRVMGKAVQPVDIKQTIIQMAAAEGLTEDEAAEAVAEVERMIGASRGSRR